MFSKLAAKNVGRSVKDYGVWFLTIVFAVCLFYVFNALETQAVFQYLGSGPTAPTAQAIRELVGMLSVFVWVVLAFLILYASGFLIRRRKKELGTYLLLGMGRGQVARLLLLETAGMGLLALVVGLGTIKENVLTGMRVGLGVAWSTIIGAEMLAATAGLGYLINLCRGIYRPDIIIASMICVGVIGAALGLVLTFVEKQLMKGGRW